MSDRVWPKADDMPPDGLTEAGRREALKRGREQLAGTMEHLQKLVADTITYHPGNRAVPLVQREAVSSMLAAAILDAVGLAGYSIVHNDDEPPY